MLNHNNIGLGQIIELCSAIGKSISSRDSQFMNLVTVSSNIAGRSVKMFVRVNSPSKSLMCPQSKNHFIWSALLSDVYREKAKYLIGVILDPVLAVFF